MKDFYIVLRELTRIVKKLKVILGENCGETPKKFWKHLKRSLKSAQGRFKV